MATDILSHSKSSTLLVTSTVDPASVVMCEALLRREGWEKMDTGAEELSQSWSHSIGNVWLTCINDSMIRADNVDSRFLSLHGIESLTDVIFLSKHSAASGQPSLTVHPIGISNLQTENTSGGIVGKFPPPNPRLSACLRELESTVQSTPLASEFSVTFETTHHGPWLSTPSMFCEIGSTSEHWGRTDAAEIWADVLYRLLNLLPVVDSNDTFERRAWVELSSHDAHSSVVCINLGGGHYAPKPGDLARRGVFMGHMLANYAFDWSESNGWKDTLVEAVSSTRIAFPGCQLSALIDKKSFKADQRKAIETLLAELDVNFYYKKEALCS